MTKFSMSLEELFEKGADADFVREMIALMARRLVVSRHVVQKRRLSVMPISSGCVVSVGDGR